MSNEFNHKIKLSELNHIINVDGFENFELTRVSDGNVGAESSICAYIKGALPNNEYNQILLAKYNIDGYNCIIVDDPKETLNKIVSHVKDHVGFKEKYAGKTDFNKVKIGLNCVIENDVYIGDGTVIEHNVVIHSGTYIGSNCLIRSGCVIGGEGYGFIKHKDGHLEREKFLGDVIIKNNVEIGYGCVIMRGLIDETIIESGAKLDNLVHVAHDCKIKENATLTAGVILCGHVTIGNQTRMAPNSTVKQRLSIGSNCIVGLGAVVLKNVPDDDVMIGNPATSLKRHRR
ncbi:UDP-3-O-(3-hydroxymyristoyl)glucosamine N-acyltransferase [Plesiomonas shigelloides]|uniref:UDP-3-O-(3-hydroxymyristoyl)glucosamine N-acyltransferase n=1 Tax=Plesiomonas shigelloides TaxID=703 RepID=UPI00387EF427